MSSAIGLAARFAEADACFPARPEAALAAVESLIPELEAADEAVILAKALMLKGNALVQLGRKEEAEAFLAEVEPIFEAMGDERGLVGVLNLRAILANRASDHVASIRLSRQALQRARGRLGIDVIANLTNNLGLDLAYLGDYTTALTLLQESLELWRKEGSPPDMIPTLINLGFTCSNAGMHDTALAYLEEAYDHAVAADDGIRQVITLSNRANELGCLKRFPEAREQAARAVEIGRQLSSDRPLAHALESWASCEEEAGNVPAARAALDEALAIYRDMGNRRGVVLNYLHLAKLPGTSKESRRNHLEKAFDLARESGLKPEQGRALAALAAVASESKEFEEAYARLSRARELEREIHDDETKRRLAAVRVQREVDSLRRELESERIRGTETAALLSEVRAQREVAKEESRQKSEILRIAAHDLRSMISGVMGCLELAEQGFGSGEDPVMLKEWVEDARSAAHELFELLRRLMDVAAIERGVISVEQTVIEVRSSLNPVLHRCRQAAEAKRQTLEVKDAGPTWISADPDRLRQMVANLVGNAVKYSPMGGHIEVRVREVDGMVRIAVCDRGPGLSAADQEHMFRPFQRLSARPTGGEVSTGLGLHIVKALAERQAATLGYADREGGGSEFYLEFPVTSPEMA